MMDEDNCGFCGNQCGFGCDCVSGTCNCEEGPASGFPESDPTIGPDSFRSTTCGFEVSWALPWSLIADNSTANWDTIALEADINANGTVIAEIWGIPLVAGTSMDQALGSFDEPNAVTTEFVRNFRNDVPDLQVVQEASGRLPMIIEYTDQGGSEVREFIYGHITEGARCAYVYLNRVTGFEFLPEGYREIEQSLKVEFGEVGSDSNPLDVTLGERISGPDAGLLTESEEAILISPAAGEVADFYATVKFTVPSDELAPWDFSIGFRDSGGDDHFRLSIISDRTWTLAYGGEDMVASGALNNLLTTLGEENTVELLAEGNAGKFAVNGVPIADLNLADALNAGSIWIATASYVENTDVNRTTEFSNFEIFTLG
jgi:hypothetical protein